MVFVLSACKVTVTQVPPPDSGDPIVADIELVRDDEAWPLADTGRDVSLRQVDGELLAAWLAGDRVVAARIASTSPATTTPFDLAAVSPTRDGRTSGARRAA